MALNAAADQTQGRAAEEATRTGAATAGGKSSASEGEKRGGASQTETRRRHTEEGATDSAGQRGERSLQGARQFYFASILYVPLDLDFW